METVLIATSEVLLTIVVLRLIRQHYDLEKRIKLLEKTIIETEYRCPECESREHCPAAFTGVAYPCEHFEKEDPDA